MEPSWLGRRVSIRRRVPGDGGETGDTRLADVVGDLLALGDALAVVEARSGPVEVRLRDVVAARLALPSTADELALETIAAAGWQPAEVGSVDGGSPAGSGVAGGGGWLLRANAGFSARANSVLPLRAPGLPLDEALAAAGAWYAERGLPLLVQVPTGARRLLDAELRARGWPALREAHVLAARLDRLAAPAASTAVQVGLADAPDEAWLRRYRDGNAAGSAARELLVRHERVAFASVRDGSGVLAVGRGVVDGQWLGVAAVEVDPAHRRTGLASAIMAALWDWGRERGARRSYLQVAAGNGAALALYERQGYWLHHSYHYRQQPRAM